MAAETMRAAILTGPRKFEIKRVPKPEIQPNEVLVHVEGCGLCGSNVGAWLGNTGTQFPSEPGAWGHEGWGVIEKVGDAVKNHKVGERVALLSSHSYAEFDVAHENHVLPIPKKLEKLPFPGEALASTMSIFSRSKIDSHTTVAVIGIGFIGALLTGLAKSVGARVIALARRNFACEVAHFMGADEVIFNSDKQQIVERILTLNNGKLCDVSVEATGSDEALDLALAVTRQRGRLVIGGHHRDASHSFNIPFGNAPLIEVIDACQESSDLCMSEMKKALTVVEQGLVEPTTLITHQYPLERIHEAMEAAHQRPDGFLKAVITLQ